MLKAFVIALVSVTLSQAVSADVCDYLPSKFIGAAPTGAVTTGAAATAAAGVGLKAAGFYTITHAVTGATMLASTAGGASAAGTVGIMGGTAGAVGTVGAVLMSPFVIIPAAAVAVGVGAYEGGCYFYAKK